MNNIKNYFMGNAKINTKKIIDLALQIKPIMNNYYLEPVDIAKSSFAVNPKKFIKTPKLETITEIQTVHPYEGSSAKFEPTLKNVLLQIPKGYLKDTVAFEIVPLSEYTDAKMVAITINKEAGEYMVNVRLYKLPKKVTLPLKIKKQAVIYNNKTYTSAIEENSLES